MPIDRRGMPRPPVRWQPERAWAATLCVAGLLLFVWPFVRTPPLSIGLSHAYLLGAWLLVVVGLRALARSLGRERGKRGRDDA